MLVRERNDVPTGAWPPCLGGEESSDRSTSFASRSSSSSSLWLGRLTSEKSDDAESDALLPVFLPLELETDPPVGRKTNSSPELPGGGPPPERVDDGADPACDSDRDTNEDASDSGEEGDIECRRWGVDQSLMPLRTAKGGGGTEREELTSGARPTPPQQNRSEYYLTDTACETQTERERYEGII